MMKNEEIDLFTANLQSLKVIAKLLKITFKRINKKQLLDSILDKIAINFKPDVCKMIISSGWIHLEKHLPNDVILHKFVDAYSNLDSGLSIRFDVSRKGSRNFAIQPENFDYYLLVAGEKINDKNQTY